MPIKMVRAFLLVVLICFWVGCHPGMKEEIPQQVRTLTKINPKAYPLFMDHNEFEGLSDAIDQSLIYFKKIPADRKFYYGNEIYTAGHLMLSLETIKAFLDKNPSSTEMNQFVRSDFLVYAAAGNDEGRVLFTGYYEPVFEGRMEKSDAFPFPVYSRPDDLVEIHLSDFSSQYKGHKPLMARVDGASRRAVPYYSRQQINEMADFHTRSRPVVWLKSRVDRFFLEVQGSGRIDLGQGDILRVHYAAGNGNQYRSIGRYLIDKNEIPKEKMSMQAIRVWLEANPQRVDEVLNHNPSFVFFKTEQGGPYGSLGVEVTAMRSIATDSSLFPKGALCFMQARLPDKKADMSPVDKWEDAALFVLNQDTGGAIKGTARADLFCGNGDYAEFTAGHMNTYGRLFFLVLKPGR